MLREEQLFLVAGQKIGSAEKSQMFGKPCFKVNGKAFICFFQDEMVFKLEGDIHKEALHLPGSKLFDPSGKSRPMKEWVQVPAMHSGMWDKFTEAAFRYVSETKK